MNRKIIEYIDEKLMSMDVDPTEQLVFFIAKMALISQPSVWIVKDMPYKIDTPCLTKSKAEEILNRHGDAHSYIAPLYYVAKADINNMEQDT